MTLCANTCILLLGLDGFFSSIATDDDALPPLAAASGMPLIGMNRIPIQTPSLPSAFAFSNRSSFADKLRSSASLAVINTAFSPSPKGEGSPTNFGTKRPHLRVKITSQQPLLFLIEDFFFSDSNFKISANGKEARGSTRTGTSATIAHNPNNHSGQSVRVVPFSPLL